MTTPQAESKRWAQAYIQYWQYREKNKVFSIYDWVNDSFMNPEAVEPSFFWEVILAVVRENSSKTIIANLAAGPMEDFIRLYGERYIEIIENEARINPQFRYLLGGVWRCGTAEPIWSRIQACRDRVW